MDISALRVYIYKKNKTKKVAAWDCLCICLSIGSGVFVRSLLHSGSRLSWEKNKTRTPKHLEINKQAIHNRVTGCFNRGTDKMRWTE